MRVYPVKIKDEETKKEVERMGVDAEDLVDEMIGLELGSPNVLENWFNLKNRLVELISAEPEPEPVEKEDKKETKKEEKEEVK